MDKTITKLVIKGKRFLSSVNKADFLFFYLLLPSIALLSYFLVYAFLYKLLSLPVGVNSNFIKKSLRVWIPWTFIVILGFSFYFKKFKRNDLVVLFKNSITRISAWDFLFLLLPMTPVVQYIFNNRNLLSPIESVYVFFILIVLSIIYIFPLAILLGFSFATRRIMFLGLSFITLIFSMAIISANYNWYQLGVTKLQWLFLSGGFLLLYALSELKDKKILYIMILIVFITNTSFSFLSPQGKAQKEIPIQSSGNALVSLVEGRIPKVTPNIYLLVFDAYVTNETMLSYGIDNSKQETFLTGKGFTLYPHTYSVAAYTLGSMSRVLNASTDFYGKEGRAASGDGIVQNLLKSIGYTTYGIFPYDYFFKFYGSSYDVSVPDRSFNSSSLLNSILMGEFRFDANYVQISREDFLKSKLSALDDFSRVPKFIYSHSEFPSHSQNSGACLPNEVSLYQERLNIANDEMQLDVNTINHDDPSAIIIIAGDHGPYLTKNCIGTENYYQISDITRLDIQDRFGTFLAIHWPAGENFNNYDEITVLQDIFPAVFAYLYQGADILNAKIQPDIIQRNVISGASVKNNIISGSQNSGESLFEEGH